MSDTDPSWPSGVENEETAGTACESQADREHYTITQLAEAFGVTPRAMRFYESKGLIHPARKGQARVYGRRDRARLSLILRAKRLGFSLAEIKEMLDLYDLNDGQTAQLRHALSKFQERIAILKSQRQDIDDAIGELEAGCEAFERMLENSAEPDKRVNVIGFAVAPPGAAP